MSHASDPWEGNWIELIGSNLVRVPMVSLNGSETICIHPHNYQSICAKNQTIYGNFYGTNQLANTTIKVNMIKLNFMNFLDTSNSSYELTKLKDKAATLKLNDTGDAPFAFINMSNGIYILYITDENATYVLSASPLLITEKDIVIYVSQQDARVGDPLAVNVRVPNGSLEREDILYGAIILPLADYENINMTVITNDGFQDAKFTINWGGNSLEIFENSKIYSAILMNLLIMFPANSAAALQESTKPVDDLYLITDFDWEPGTYILICGVLSEKGLVGLKEVKIKLVK